MLCRVKMEFVIGFIFVFASASSFSTEDEKTMTQWRKGLNDNFIKIEEKLNYFNKKMKQLEQRNSSAGNNDAFDAMHEILINITRAISHSNDKLANKFNKIEENQNKMEKKFDENFMENKKIEENNYFKEIQKIEKKLNKMESILFQLLNASDAERSDEVWSGVTSQCESMCRTKLSTWANHTGSQLRTKVEQMELYNSSKPKAVVDACHPNPCLNGGRCRPRPTSTESGYQCACSKFTSGSRCKAVECTVENKCWRLKDTLYTIIDTKLNWAEAKVKCESMGMTLAMPKDQERTQFLKEQLKPIYSAQHHLWLGLKRDEGGSGWFWVDGSDLGQYQGGHSNMKSISGSNCAILCLTCGGGKLWGRASPTHYFYAVCEAKLIFQ